MKIEPIPTRWSGLKLEAVFRNGDLDYIFRWTDRKGEIKVIETCRPIATRFYQDEK